MTDDSWWAGVMRRRLHRNGLCEPFDTPAEVASATCGIQAQAPAAARLALAVRLRPGWTPERIDGELLERRTLVRTFGPRGTVHLLPAAELATWLAALRALPGDGRWTDAWNVTPREASRIVGAVDEALAGRCLTREQLARDAGRRLGDRAAERLAAGRADLIALAALAGVACFGPPRGSHVTFVRVADWLGRQLEEPAPRDALRRLLRRYLHAYGPARPADVARWLGARELRPADIRGLLDDAAVPMKLGRTTAYAEADTVEPPAPPSAPHVRLVGRYDCYLLGSRFGRERVVDARARQRLAAHPRGRYEGSAGHNCLLLNGVVAGIWEGDATELRVEPFIPLDRAMLAALDEDAGRVGRYLGGAPVLSLGPLPVSP